MRERSGWRELDSNHRSRGRPRRSRGISSRLRRLSVGGDMSPSRNLLSRVTDGSNPASSSGESSANLTFGGRISRWRVPAGRGRRPDRGRDHLGTRTRGRQPKADDNLRRRRCRPEGRPEADHELVLGAFFRRECRVPRAAFGFAASVDVAAGVEPDGARQGVGLATNFPRADRCQLAAPLSMPQSFPYWAPAAQRRLNCRA